ncbi:FAD/NAD(P)-binding protein [Corynebacterium diphtheriae]|uniref:FAD/NAD(P)-binding protein n=1 Tax=Corynebacterium diphtheriae TaxID=1717 RepID=UPI0008FB55AD|nr:FAD/NAD(P)-binding protein [Corynebacterium diphtheriae]OIR65720.1 hypothetical protein BHF73_10735 [Corynebacterium diphtheriae]OIR67914.1 hypothetical protein BHF77_05950 [Corynebacterium diphtheriae]OIR68283.1 hypothetical protein BHF76_06680 [Corynebacterium diphtheriae]OIR75213.1 hypothetical protein BHF78_05620 [Corynebacterium diphtheriae]OIR77452.1 hypothetical protein BHF81_10750 [Corynebacterium diphtheriae]
MITLKRPLILAPMAGGPSAPELCVAVTNAGGLGNIAAGYLTPEKLISAIQQVEGEADGPYGINIFCPPPDRERSSKDQDLWKRYRVLLEKDTQILGELPEQPFTGDDFYREKIDIALSSQAQVVSFTFGYPDETLIHEFQEAGKSVVLNATTPHEIDFLASTSCDAICVQGAEAGGHRATVLSTESEGSTHSTSELLEYALSKVSKPVIAAGGIATAKEALALLRRGAWAIQVGTHFLLADEAGTKHTHKIALKELSGRPTTLTKAFTGRLARAITNTFTEKYSQSAPSMYPELHHLTSELRANANYAGDVESLNLWAGVNYGCTHSAPAADIVDELTPYSTSLGVGRVVPLAAQVAVVGGGPRGLAVVERTLDRLAHSNDREETPVLVWFDDSSFGSGKVWNPYQTPALLMNTVASQLSGFPDSSAGIEGRYLEGPTFYEWLKSEKASAFLHSDPVLLEEALQTGPDTYTSRALYGAYLHWVASQVVTAYRDYVDIHLVPTRVLSISDQEGAYALMDSDGHTVVVKNVVLAVGHTSQQMSESELEMARSANQAGLIYLPRGGASPKETSRISPNDTVILRGMGLTFFDYLELLTEYRGGRFSSDGDTFRYIPSGKEPKIIACSRKGAPHHARGRNQKQPNERWLPRFLTEDFARTLDNASFSGDVWPKILLEVELAFTIALLEQSGLDSEKQEAESRAQMGVKELIHWRQEIGLSETLDWSDLLSPRWVNAPGCSLSDYQRAVSARLRADIDAAEQGNKVGPLKTALDTLRDLRNEIRACVQYGRISGRSYATELMDRYSPNNAFLSIGPPVERIKQLKALVDAGVVTILPAESSIDLLEGRGAYSYFAPTIPDSQGWATVLIEARLPSGAIHHTADPLLGDLLSRGIVKPHLYSETSRVSGASDVNPKTFIAYQSGTDKNTGLLFAYGIPLEGIQWGTAATIRPFVNSVIITDADVIARQIQENTYG